MPRVKILLADDHSLYCHLLRDYWSLEAGRRLKKTNSKVKLIYLTRNNNVEYAREALQGGASAFVLKNAQRHISCKPSATLCAEYPTLRPRFVKR